MEGLSFAAYLESKRTDKEPEKHNPSKGTRVAIFDTAKSDSEIGERSGSDF